MLCLNYVTTFQVTEYRHRRHIIAANERIYSTIILLSHNLIFNRMQGHEETHVIR